MAQLASNSSPWCFGSDGSLWIVSVGGSSAKPRKFGSLAGHVQKATGHYTGGAVRCTFTINKYNADDDTSDDSLSRPPSKVLLYFASMVSKVDGMTQVPSPLCSKVVDSTAKAKAWVKGSTPPASSS